jgi:hypothetical protein
MTRNLVLLLLLIWLKLPVLRVFLSFKAPDLDLIEKQGV